MKAYLFDVVVEPDGDKWHAYCPALERYAATTWGNTEQEAYKNIYEVVQMVVDELIEDGKPVPDLPQGQVQVFSKPKVLVTV